MPGAALVMVSRIRGVIASKLNAVGSLEALAQVTRVLRAGTSSGRSSRTRRLTPAAPARPWSVRKAAVSPEKRCGDAHDRETQSTGLATLTARRLAVLAALS